MYGTSDRVSDERAASLLLLRDTPFALRDAMMDAALAWPIAAAHNLTDTGSNRRAWLGQAACCLAHGATQFATCLAWWELTLDEREAANAVADSVLAQWETEVVYGAETIFAR
jgi:hypothetical protein